MIPEKACPARVAGWITRFPKSSCSMENQEREGDSTQSHRALEGRGRVRLGHDPRGGHLTAARSNCRSIWLPRDTAVSSASFADFLPASAASISSDQTSRICTMPPKRKPREFSVGG